MIRRSNPGGFSCEHDGERIHQLMKLKCVSGIMSPGVLRIASLTGGHLSFHPDYASRSKDQRDQRNYPRREKRDRYTDHAQTPHDCGRALGHGPPKRGNYATLLRNNIALTVNLDRDVRGCVRFVDLGICAILTLHTNVLDLP
jgi:hypothetical protein